MNRRLFMAGTAALIAAPKMVLAGSGAGSVNYTPGLIKDKLAAGETVFVDYAADWCGTCARQERVIDELRAANPDFDKSMTFVRVDWDQYGSHEVATSRNIPRRSTLVLLRGDEELGRIVAGTDAGQIQELMELGLATA